MTRTARTSPAASQPAANRDALALTPRGRLWPLTVTPLAAMLAANPTQPVPGQSADYFFKCASNHPITVWYHSTLLAGFNTQ
jgi:hypothetical protein